MEAMTRLEFISLVEQIGGYVVYEYHETESATEFLIIINLMNKKDELAVTLNQEVDLIEAYNFFRDNYGYDIGLVSFREYVRENRLLRKELSEHFDNIQIAKQ